MNDGERILLKAEMALRTAKISGCCETYEVERERVLPALTTLQQRCAGMPGFLRARLSHNIDSHKFGLTIEVVKGIWPPYEETIFRRWEGFSIFTGYCTMQQAIETYYLRL